MQLPGRPSWRVDENASSDVLVALYLRDALGVSDPSGLPRVLGTGLGPVPAADDRTTWGWTRWWVSVTAPDSGIRPFAEAGGEAFEALVRRHLDDARAWADVVHTAYGTAQMERQFAGTLDDVVGEAVRAWEADAGRPAHPFRLRIEVLPLTASGVWWIGEHAIAVDDLLREDLPAWRAALEPIIARLAAGPVE
jgi:hypothetical protein